MTEMDSSEKRARILVTGGAGFLGSHLIDRLMSRGDEVLCADNLFTGSQRNLAHWMGHPRFEFLPHDVSCPLSAQVDQIYNLACPASPIHYQSNPVETIRTNVLGAIHVLDLAKRLKAPIFQASTSEVYGDPLVHPQAEDYWGNVNPIGIRSCYDEGKRCAETLFFDYHRQYQVDIRVARIFNTYGPRMNLNDGRVVSNFIVQALQNEPITIYGDGRQTRSFCYVDDLIEGFLRFMDLPPPSEGAVGCTGPINLGNPHEFTIEQLAKMVVGLTGSASKIIHKPPLADDPMQRKPDIGLAQKHLNDWQPSVQLEEGLQKTIAYFDKVLRQGE